MKEDLETLEIQQESIEAEPTNVLEKNKGEDLNFVLTVTNSLLD